MSSVRKRGSILKQRVAVTIVTHNDAHNIERCLRSLGEQSYRDFTIVVVDNNSCDETRALLRKFSNVSVILNSENRGFSVAQNQAIGASDSEWVFCLNPDTRLDRECLRELCRAGEVHSRIGMVCPKILRMSPDGSISDPRVIDSAGCYITTSLRHFDRGSEEIDYGQYDRPEYVFGYTGAAVLLRREMIREISVGGEFMDENFFFFREDADVSWRAQLMGWDCLYVPMATAYHVRRVLPSRRRSLPPAINLHSTKNRFLMRINNMSAGVYRKVFVAATVRDIGILAYVLLFERSSLPGLLWIIQNFRSLLRKRRLIQARKVTPDSEIRCWFADKPRTRLLAPHLLSQLISNSRSMESRNVS